MGWVSVPENTNFEELYHYGAKGMRWGRRRWQNPDGSYTNAGRVHYGIGFGRKRKLSKDAQMRAKEKTRAKNEAARQEAFEAETRRAIAEADAERAKTALREAKKQNSLAYKLGSKAASAASDKMAERKAEKEANKPLSKNAEKYVEAIQSGNKRKIKKFASKLNNDEYRKAIDRINMKYEMDRAATDAKIAKGRQAVARMRNAADIMGAGTDIWNAGAGIVSAFSGVNVPKINTKYQDPIDILKKQVEYETKKESLRTTKATAVKAEATAKKEVLSYKEAKKKYDSEHPESTVSSTESLKEDASSSKPKWMTDWREKSEKDAAKRSAEKTYSYEPERKITTNVTANDAVKALNALTNGGYTGKTKSSPVTSYKFKVEDLQTPINSIHVDKKAKKLVDEYTIPRSKIHYDPDYNEIMVKEGRRNFDVSKLPKEQQQIFFAMLNGLK